MQSANALAACLDIVDLQRQLEAAIVRRDVALRGMHFEDGVPRTRVAEAIVEESEAAGCGDRDAWKRMGVSKANIRLMFERPSQGVLDAERSGTLDENGNE